MIAKKICLLGSFAVGKTSLVRRYVESIFDEKYHTTIGVKIDKKQLHCRDTEVQLMIWDIEGRDEFTNFRHSYLRGASGFFLVIDLTRPASLQVAKELLKQVEQSTGPLPFVALFNKADLEAERQISAGDIQQLEQAGWDVYEVSAKTGENVEDAFLNLTEKMLLTHSELHRL